MPLDPKRIFLPRFGFLLMLCVSVGTTARSGEVSKELKEKLFARYDQKNLNISHEKILVTALNGSSADTLSYSINYDYFHALIPKSVWPKKYLSRNLIAENVTEEVESSARFTDPLNVGEMVRARKFYVEANKSGALFIDFYLVALDGKRVAPMQQIYSDGSRGLLHPVAFGFHFRFIFPPVDDVNARLPEITKEIGHYLIPTDEYQQDKRAARDAAESNKNINIEPGMSEDEVVGKLGEPQKRIQFGNKTILKYADISVELEDKKVTQVKVN